ncbi:MAG: nucleotidyltransferase domain-containing protein [Actinomycetota bacterium]|nr:nucleotidyltransferase domain-containing protein [Actinomycetota bacterium]
MTDVVLSPEAISGLAAALERDGVVAAALFGSQATGATGPLSDVDVSIWLDPALDRGRRLELRLELTAAACAALATEALDLLVLNDAPPLLQHRALSQRRLLVDRDPRARVHLEAWAQLRYLDTALLRDELARGLRHRLAEGRFGRP